MLGREETHQGSQVNRLQNATGRVEVGSDRRLVGEQSPPATADQLGRLDEHLESCLHTLHVFIVPRPDPEEGYGAMGYGAMRLCGFTGLCGDQEVRDCENSALSGACLAPDVDDVLIVIRRDPGAILS